MPSNTNNFNMPIINITLNKLSEGPDTNLPMLKNIVGKKVLKNKKIGLLRCGFAGKVIEVISCSGSLTQIDDDTESDKTKDIHTAIVDYFKNSEQYIVATPVHFYKLDNQKLNVFQVEPKYLPKTLPVLEKLYDKYYDRFNQKITQAKIIIEKGEIGNERTVVKKEVINKIIENTSFISGIHGDRLQENQKENYTNFLDRMIDDDKEMLSLFETMVKSDIIYTSFISNMDLKFKTEWSKIIYNYITKSMLPDMLSPGLYEYISIFYDKSGLDHIIKCDIKDLIKLCPEKCLLDEILRDNKIDVDIYNSIAYIISSRSFDYVEDSIHEIEGIVKKVEEKATIESLSSTDKLKIYNDIVNEKNNIIFTNIFNAVYNDFDNNYLNIIKYIMNRIDHPLFLNLLDAYPQCAEDNALNCLINELEKDPDFKQLDSNSEITIDWYVTGWEKKEFGYRSYCEICKVIFEPKIKHYIREIYRLTHTQDEEQKTEEDEQKMDS